MNRQNDFKYLWTVVRAADLEKAVLEVVEKYSWNAYDIVEEVGSLYIVDERRNFSPLNIPDIFSGLDLRWKEIVFWGRSILPEIYNQVYLNSQKERIRKAKESADPADWWKNA